MEITKIGVIGAGVMGHGIALVSAQAGYQVIIRDIDDKFVKSGIDRIDKFLAKGVEKGKLSENEKEEI
ncbi:MAG: 3-hydroxyacyl-CoA dehydrogenase NAD-binding domain-containing protein, partial [Candidatus Thermoplasmatota archaeon]|nr:3-hydroxyacyl-CoA dehydrogenase NAD-binding domain-containing protein [Candidatus Thermoplasmatota archaeon]